MTILKQVWYRLLRLEWRVGLALAAYYIVQWSALPLGANERGVVMQACLGVIVTSFLAWVEKVSPKIPRGERDRNNRYREDQGVLRKEGIEGSGKETSGEGK